MVLIREGAKVVFIRVEGKDGGQQEKGYGHQGRGRMWWLSEEGENVVVIRKGAKVMVIKGEGEDGSHQGRGEDGGHQERGEGNGHQRRGRRWQSSGEG